MMEKIFISFATIFIFFLVQNSNAQLKHENYLILDQSKHRFEIANGPSGFKGFFLYDTGFSFSTNLYFEYFENLVPARDCCAFLEVNKLPKQWNIIKMEDLISFLEKKTYINRLENKIFFVLKGDKGKNYKVYQVELRKTWLLE